MCAKLEKFGFKAIGGEVSENWLILRNADHTIGLFQGMFEQNTSTFNPGWDKNASCVDNITDIRELRLQLMSDGVELMSDENQSSEGPASFITIDPDGNPILVNQHV